MTKSNHRRGGFALAELLIVVVIMAILAATIMSQFSSSTSDAKTSSAKFNLHTLRSQIELYRSQHAGMLPTQQLIELTSSTNSSGVIGTAGASFPYGPYVTSIPMNPITSSNTVVAAPAAGAVPTAVISGAGWQYDAGTGKLWFNDNAYYPFSRQ